MLNVLLSSVGRRSYLASYFRDALKGDGRVIGTNCVPGVPGLQAVDVPIIVPAASAPDYVPTMLKLCEIYDVRCVFSLHDLEAPYLVAYQTEFEKRGTKLVMPDSRFLMVCLDKYATSRFALEHGLKVPTTCLGLARSQDAIARGELAFPLIVKPRHATGSIGLFLVSSPDELVACIGLCQKEILCRPFLNAMSFADHETVVVQQMLQGQEYGLNILNDLDGNFAACFVVHKLGMHSGETDAGETVHHPVLEEIGERLGRAFRHPGLMDVDVIVQDQTPYILDINPRFGGHYPFAHMGGANAPAALVAWARGEQPNPEWLTTVPQVRSFKDITILRCVQLNPGGSDV